MKRILLLFVALSATAEVFSQDLSVSAITAPVSSCSMTSTQNVTISVINYGPMLTTGNTFNVTYVINAGTPVTELVTLGANLATSATLSYTFTTQANLSVAGTYTFDANVNIAGDINTANDLFAGHVVINSSSSVGGTISGSTSFCSTTNSGNLVLSGHTGMVLRWEFSNDGGLTWINMANTTTTQSFSNVTQNRLYRAMVQNGFCPSAYSANASITIFNSPVVSITPSSTTTCSGSPVTLTASGAMTYAWAPGNLVGASVVVTPAVTETYTVTGADANGCYDVEIITIVVNQPPTVTATMIEATCNVPNGSATAFASGNGPFTYYWQPSGHTTVMATALPAGIHTVSVTDFNNCTTSANVTVGDSCDFVWPGDANDDAVADNIDILDIGIANGANGTTRANATTAWIGQPSAPWGQTLLSGTDYKWVDCNGDGTISPLDTQVVILNYGMTHTNRYSAPVYAAAPTLSVTFDQDSVAAGNSGSLTLSLGDASNQAVSAYGIAFRLNYDAAQIGTSSLGLSGGSSWLGTPGNDLMRVVLHPSPTNGFVDVAITRLDQQPVTGFGTIAQIYFTATTMLNGTGNAASVPMTVTNVVLVDQTGLAQSVNASGDSVVVADSALITTIAHVRGEQSQVYPNPANETLNLVIAGSDAQQLVTIEDLSGRIVYSKQHTSGANTIDVTALPAGTYVLRVQGNNNSFSVHRVTVAH